MLYFRKYRNFSINYSADTYPPILQSLTVNILLNQYLKEDVTNAEFKKMVLKLKNLIRKVGIICIFVIVDPMKDKQLLIQKYHERDNLKD